MAAPPRRVAALRALLPHGRELDPADFAARHKAIVWVLYAHAVFIAGFGIARGFEPIHALLEASVIAVLAFAASISKQGRSSMGVLSAIGLVTSSALLVHLSGGTIEAHFHFFVVLGLISLYQDWKPYLIAIGYVVVHHGFMGVVQPSAVYNHASAQNNPWLWAAIHGGFVLAACMVQVFSWRMNEIEKARAEALHEKLTEAGIRRQQALELNDTIVQGLVVAQMAASIGEHAHARDAIDAALGRARKVISDMLGDGQGSRVQPGELVRSTPARHERNSDEPVSA
jgi:hypothetical protein